MLVRLQAADPAASLSPADPDRLAQLMEATTTDTRTEREITESREMHTHGRSPLTWLVAAAAVVLIAGAGFFALGNRGHETTPQAAPSVTQLSVAAPQGRCMVPNVNVLKVQTVAFRATITGLTAGEITFSVHHWYKGGPTTLAKVVAPQTALRPLVASAKFKLGGDYLVSAHDGQVTACGFSAPYTASLAGLYGQAYGN
jgi:hypothetical protein